MVLDLNNLPTKNGQVAITPGNNNRRTFFLVSFIRGSIFPALNRKYKPKINPIKKYIANTVKNMLIVVII